MTTTTTTPDTLKDWMIDQYQDGEIAEIAEHGCDAGWSGISYTSDCAALFDTYQDEIWNLLVDTADSLGEDPMTLIAGFRRSDMTKSGINEFKNLLVWFAVEHYANEMSNQDDTDDGN